MKIYNYSNDFGAEYSIMQFNRKWVISQDGVFTGTEYKTLKDAKKAIDNQEVYFF